MYIRANVLDSTLFCTCYVRDVGMEIYRSRQRRISNMKNSHESENKEIRTRDYEYVPTDRTREKQKDMKRNRQKTAIASEGSMIVMETRMPMTMRGQ